MSYTGVNPETNKIKQELEQTDNNPEVVYNGKVL